jgi:Spy/CpxP family protein refolding chaperone
MSRSLKWRLIVGFVLVFIAGTATGLFAGAWHAREAFVGRHGGMMGPRLRQHIQRELDLTPEQLRQVDPILREMTQQLQTIRRESGRRVAETMEQSRRALEPHLTPEQQQRMEEMKRQHMRKRHIRRLKNLRDASPPPASEES